MNPEECAACRDEVVWYALSTNAFLTFLKVCLGLLSGSSALVADALHSFSDVVANLATIASLKISSRPADDQHPYGYGHAQFIATAFVGLILVVGGIYILIGAGRAVLTGDVETPSWIALVGAVISIALNELMFHYEDCVGKKNNCPAIIADAWDNRSDALSSTGVLIGVGLATLGFAYGDAIAAIAVGLLVVKIGVKLTVEAIDGLMDASAEAELVARIDQLARSVFGVLDVGLVRARLVGEEMHVDIEVVVDGDRKVYEGDLIADHLRTRVQSEVAHIGNVQVFLTPPGETAAQGEVSVMATSV
ncbi:MAG: magnetosome biogenesis CDF transporter MamB [Thermodesulfobacteriota bacterium]